MKPLGPTGLRLVPLGGLGEIGMNCLALEQADGILVVDCGTSFPHDDLGIDVLHPDFSWLFAHADQISGVFLTHGHEDHIGALPYLLGTVPLPVWGPPHALGLAERRLREHGLKGADLRVATPGRGYEVGGFTVEPVRVAHSIVEATALRIGTAAGTVVHSGDFNFDPAPPDGEPTDEARLAEIGAEGVDLLLSDSTNVDVEANPGGERDVGAALDRIVARADARVFVSLFASNIQRLIMLGNIALAHGRKLCVLGRSLRTQVEIAASIGRLRWPSDLQVPPEVARTMPRDAVMVLAGGTQGERHASLTRLANGTHPELAIEPGDSVVLSSRIIPGHERAVFAVMNEILRRGAHLHTRITDPSVHTSGHACRGEQRRMLELIRPRSFIPVHGTLHHLRRHAELARELGVADVMVVENGAVAHLDGEGLRADGSVPHGVVAVGLGGEPVSTEVLRQRADLGRSGVAVVALAVDRAGRIVSGPKVSVLGLAGDGQAGQADAAREASRALGRAMRQRLEQDGVVEAIRRSVRRALEKSTGVKPIVEVHYLECD